MTPAKKIRTPAALAKLLGVRTEVRSSLTPRWDGRSLNLHGLTTQHRVHELMHWLLATPYRRSVPNFGHGSDSTNGGSVRSTIGWKKARHEETMICIMTSACMVMMGIWTEEAVLRQVDKSPEWLAARKELVKRKLLDARHRPILPGLTYE